MDEEARARRVVAQMMEADAFSRWLGIDIAEIRVGYARLTMTVRPDMLNGFGVGHGGVTFSFADSALAFASNGHGTLTMSIDAAMNYPTSVRLGDTLTAEARECAAGGPIAHYTVTVTNGEGTPVGLFRGTVYRTKKPHLPDDVD